MQRRWIVIVATVVALGVVLGAGITGFFLWRTVKNTEDTFIPGVMIDGVELAGMTRQEAVAYLEQMNDARMGEMRIQFRYADREWILEPQELQTIMDIDAQVNVAWRKGHTGGFFERLSDIQDTRAHPVDFGTDIQYSQQALQEKLLKIQAEIDKPVAEATMTFNPNKTEKFTIEKESPGYEMDYEAVYNQALDMLTAYRGGVIDIPVKTIEPTITAEALQQGTTRICKFTTDLGRSTRPRIENIELALSHYNGMIMKPGQSVSFNDTTGDRTPERGYQDAPQIYGNNLVDGPGGGVCQASTTLYQAWLRAGLKVEKRYKHSIPSSYVEKGQDAAVSYGSKDLVLHNDSDLPVYIYCGVADNKVFVALYGRKLETGVTIKIESEIIQELPPVDPSIVKDYEEKYVKYTDQYFDDPPSRTGYEVKTYRVWLQDKKEVKREQLTHDTYRNTPGTRYVGVTERGSSSSASSSSSSSSSDSGSSDSGSSKSTPKPTQTEKPRETEKPAATEAPVVEEPSTPAEEPSEPSEASE